MFKLYYLKHHKKRKRSLEKRSINLNLPQVQRNIKT